MTKNRIERIQFLTSDMINQNRLLLEQVMESLIQERFSDQDKCPASQ